MVFEVQVSSAGAVRQHNNNRAAAKKLHEKMAGADFGQPWCRAVMEAIDAHSQPMSMLWGVLSNEISLREARLVA